MKLSEWYDKNNTDIITGKVLIAGTTGNGIDLFFQLAEEIGGIMGVECKNIVNTAFPVVTEKLTKECSDILSLTGFCRIDDDECADVVMFIIEANTDSLFFDDKTFDSIETFRIHIGKILTKETACEIYRICRMIRMNRLEDRLSELSKDNCRLKRVAKVISLFEDYLSKNNIYDDVRLLREAVSYLKDCDGKCPATIPEYARLDDHIPTVLETELLTLLAKGREVPVITAKTGSEPEKSFFRTYGMADEIRCIAKEIKDKGLYQGDVCIFFPQPGYRNVIKSVLTSEGLTAAFTDPYSASESESILFFLYFMDWVQNEYRIEYFEKLLYSQAIEFRDEEDNILWKTTAMNYLSSIGYLYTRRPYEKLSENKCDAEEQFLSWSKSDDIRKINEKTIAALKGFVSRLLEAATPDSRDGYSIKGFLERITSVYRDYRIKSGVEKKYFPIVDIALDKLLAALELNKDRCYSIEKTCASLKKALMDITLSDKEDRDIILVRTIGQRKMISSRKYNYVVGMSSDLLLRKTDDSPVMYDSEIMECFGGNKEIAEQYCGSKKNERIKDALEYLLGSQNKDGSFTFSYPYYDQSELRKRAVSGIFEELRGSSTVDERNTLAMENEEFIYNMKPVEPEKPSEDEKEKEDTAGEQTTENVQQTEQTPQADQPEQADKAEQDKEDESKYVGNILEYIRKSSARKKELWDEEKKKDADVRKKRSEIALSDEDREAVKKDSKWEDNDREYKLSATSFDHLLQCPKKYVLEKMYHLSAETQDTSGQMEWLSPLKRGSLFHAVIENYVKRLLAESRTGSVDLSNFNADVFKEVFDEMVREYELIPAALIRRKNMQMELIRKAAYDFLAGTSDNNDGTKYYTTDAELGWDQDIIDKIALGKDADGKERYFTANYRKGAIDRLDHYLDDKGKKHYRIVDYKTGRIESFVKEDTYLLIQHYVYNKVLRAIKDDIPEDEDIRFVFVFPTDDTHSQYVYNKGIFELKGNDETKCSMITIEDFELTDQIRKLLAAFISRPVHDKLSYRQVGEILYPAEDETGENDTQQSNGNESDLHSNSKYCDFINICGLCSREEDK